MFQSIFYMRRPLVNFRQYGTQLRIAFAQHQTRFDTPALERRHAQGTLRQLFFLVLFHVLL